MILGSSARFSRSTAAFALSAAALVATTASAQPGPSAEVKAGARAAAEKGSEEYKAGHYAQALDLFNRAESLIHAPTHLLMIARTSAAMGKLVAAREAYLRVVREELAAGAPPAFKKAREEAEKELKDLEPRIPSVLVAVSDPAAKNLVVTMDGTPVPAALVGIERPVDPGKHVFAATADGLAAPERSLEVKEKEKTSIKLALEPVRSASAAPPPPPPVAPVKPALTPAAPPPAPDKPAAPTKTSTLRYVGFGMIGVGAVGLGVGAAFGALSLSKRGEANDAFDKCPAGCPVDSDGAKKVNALDADANTKGTIGIAALVGGGVLAATGVVLVVLGKPKPATTATTVSPWIGAGSAGLSGRF